MSDGAGGGVGSRKWESDAHRHWDCFSPDIIDRVASKSSSILSKASSLRCFSCRRSLAFRADFLDDRRERTSWTDSSSCSFSRASLARSDWDETAFLTACAAALDEAGLDMAASFLDELALAAGGGLVGAFFLAMLVVGMGGRSGLLPDVGGGSPVLGSDQLPWSRQTELPTASTVQRAEKKKSFVQETDLIGLAAVPDSLPGRNKTSC
ncbi:uncharacterized protein BJ171DRAFT_513386 [Polychytrium aggregatum]|uniref:uncharacterized protein n=1 Tax=Polychytrium aggregatum TaxID=110093 RepID=UPI0022FDB13B|nr:uncharacterized protein BJ171DRAFT_513386 [Polychytrium aggregatum]KAI9202545.1 hypothetical protein BJ171DRAFT_513386 [Polychytrium aggregatum]